MLTILKQIDRPSVEGRVVSTYANTHDGVAVVNATLASLPNHLRALKEGAVPIGTVQFVQGALRTLMGGNPPLINMYPVCLKSFMYRDYRIRLTTNLLPDLFTKPFDTKLYNGFILRSDAGEYDEHDLEQYITLKQLPNHVLHYQADLVEWQLETRVYVHHGRIVGVGRYDDKDTPDSLLDMDVVQQIVDIHRNEYPNMQAYAIDVGVLSTGETALVEVNDAYALGFYRGTLSVSSYINMLVDRWQDLRYGESAPHKST